MQRISKIFVFIIRLLKFDFLNMSELRQKVSMFSREILYDIAVSRFWARDLEKAMVGFCDP
ncbi:hypothetical protein GWO43_03855 [candidate division KSB1 bacterium]|nr:hypothetical protein [candidate division KSB1 bacterium]NIT70036.1 hypothetical protein [candidate division KSB1 bacterium]NIU91432.1 hypothetical protein [candidate division KSB1 bacterium]NIX69717.1 hypothetical protein [candidate division KSB1 bacterium]